MTFYLSLILLLGVIRNWSKVNISYESIINSSRILGYIIKIFLALLDEEAFVVYISIEVNKALK